LQKNRKEFILQCLPAVSFSYLTVFTLRVHFLVHLFFEMLLVLVFWLISFNCTFCCHIFFVLMLQDSNSESDLDSDSGIFAWFLFCLLMSQADLVLAFTAHTHIYFWLIHLLPLPWHNQCSPTKLRLEIRKYVQLVLVVR